MPESKGSTMCLTFFQGQIWVINILTIEVITVGGDEGVECEVGITLKNLGFREEQYCRVMDLGVMGETGCTSFSSFYIPRYDIYRECSIRRLVSF